MSLKRKLSVLMLAAAASLFGLSCNQARVANRNRLDEQNFPLTVLWAWERAEDLEFLDPRQFAVAFLAQTRHLERAFLSATTRLSAANE